MRIWDCLNKNIRVGFNMKLYLSYSMVECMGNAFDDYCYR